ncbi:MAG: response regulator transcription factor [Mariprofundales bacterium]
MHILIIDDHHLFRLGLSRALLTLDKDTVISEAGCLAEAKDSLKANPQSFDLILLDQILPDGEGINFLHHIQQHYPLIPVAMLSGEEDVGLMKRALESGAFGFIPKSTDIAIILTALQLILSGGIYIPSSMMPSLCSNASTKVRGLNTRSEQLTQRQQEVMELITQGLSNKEIAWQLNISDGTVKTHVTAILKAKKLHGRKQIIAMNQTIGS